MTAKEALREAIDGMSEAEAAQLLDFVERTPGRTLDPDDDDLVQFLRQWWSDHDAQGGGVSDELQRAIAENAGVRLRERHVGS